MLEVRVMYVPKDRHNTRIMGMLLIGKDGSIALSRYGRATKLYSRGIIEQYERHNGWDLIFEALKLGLKRKDGIDEIREPEEGQECEAKGKRKRTKDEKVSGEPGV